MDRHLGLKIYQPLQVESCTRPLLGSGTGPLLFPSCVYSSWSNITASSPFWRKDDGAGLFFVDRAKGFLLGHLLYSHSSRLPPSWACSVWSTINGTFIVRSQSSSVLHVVNRALLRVRQFSTSRLWLDESLFVGLVLAGNENTVLSVISNPFSSLCFSSSPLPMPWSLATCGW